jgi:catechol 2,3-dioxygenase-like lactoylglutathione lyase family enzyme
VVYAIDVHHLKSDANGDTEAHLYRDGARSARVRLPAVFPIEGGTIEVATSAFGVRRCHFVTTDGIEQQLVPDPRSGEGRRARLDRERPVLSRWIGVLTVSAVLGSMERALRLRYNRWLDPVAS